MYDVFVSYCSADRARVAPIVDRLLALGLKTYFDQSNLEPGAEYPDAIDTALKSARLVLAFWTREAVTRPWVKRECRIAQLRQVLLPIALEPLSELELPTEFVGVQFLSMFDLLPTANNFEWTTLVRALGERLDLPTLSEMAQMAARMEKDLSTPLSKQDFELVHQVWINLRYSKDKERLARFLERDAAGTPVEFLVEERLDQLKTLEAIQSPSSSGRSGEGGSEAVRRAKALSTLIEQLDRQEKDNQRKITIQKNVVDMVERAAPDLKVTQSLKHIETAREELAKLEAEAKWISDERRWLINWMSEFTGHDR